MAESFQIYKLPDPTAVGLKVEASLQALADVYAQPMGEPTVSGKRFFAGYYYRLTSQPHPATPYPPGIFLCNRNTDWTHAFNEVAPGVFMLSSDFTYITSLNGGLLGYDVIALPPIGIRVYELKGVNITRIPAMFQNYVLSEIGQGPPGFATLFFVKQLTDDFRANPTPYRTYTTNEEYPWPDVLIGDLNFTDNGFSGYSLTRKMRTGATLDSPVLVELFQGDHLPFPDTLLEHTEPVPREIYWNVLANSGRLNCLHKKITIPGYTSSVEGITYKETNFEDWGEFILRCRQEFIDGAYHLKRETIRPAYLPDPIEL